MSSPLAIAGVTYVLRDLLADSVVNNDLSGNIKVTARPPLREPSSTAGDQSQLNVFLYQIAPNAAWRNAALPSRDSTGARVSNAPLALDLHYLVTAYDERDYHAEILLGYAMQCLHENPGLSRKQIRDSLKSDIADDPGTEPQLPPELKRLTQTGLADQFESIKITPHYPSSEEMSKLWTGFQAPYRPSMAYQVSVVLIESERSARTPLPVRTRNLKVMPFAFSALDEISPVRVAAGGTVTLRGTNLGGSETRLLFGQNQVVPTVISEMQITATVPAGLTDGLSPEQGRDRLRAGINTVRFVRDVSFRTPNEPHGGFESNALAFQLIPVIKPVVAPGSPEQFTASRGGTLSIDVTPAVASGQKVALLLNPVTPDPGKPPMTLTLEPRLPATDKSQERVPFKIPATAVAGNYLLRFRVDGADSELTRDMVASSPTYQQYIGPVLTIT